MTSARILLLGLLTLAALLFSGNSAGADSDSILGSDDPSVVGSTVSAGNGHTCGVRTDGTLACWGYNNAGRAPPPAGTFSQVSAGQSHTCGLRTDGTLACWGDNGSGQASPPVGDSRKGKGRGEQNPRGWAD